MLLRNATLADGSAASVRIRDGVIEAVSRSQTLACDEDESVVDLEGRLLLPSLVEAHAHLDKAFTAPHVKNPAGDLMGAVDAWYSYRETLSVDDIRARARRAALAGLAKGVTAIRTHVDVGSGIGLRAVQAVASVRDELAGLVDIEIVALTSVPATGSAGAGNRALLRDALDCGADAVGGAPHVDPDPAACLEVLLETAAQARRPVDLHMDETLDPNHLGLEQLAATVAAGFDQRVTASHCVSLSMQPRTTQRRVADAVAAAGISVVTLPQTNLYLQARGLACAPPRGLTALDALRAAGVNVAAGGDNVRDPFNPLGRADPLEAAALLVAAGHVDTTDAYQAVTAAARAALGLPQVEVARGHRADLVAIAASSIDEAIAGSTEDRLVFRGGALVARTSVATQIDWPALVEGT